MNSSIRLYRFAFKAQHVLGAPCLIALVQKPSTELLHVVYHQKFSKPSDKFGGPLGRKARAVAVYKKTLNPNSAADRVDRGGLGSYARERGSG